MTSGPETLLLDTVYLYGESHQSRNTKQGFEDKVAAGRQLERKFPKRKIVAEKNCITDLEQSFSKSTCALKRPRKHFFLTLSSLSHTPY